MIDIETLPTDIKDALIKRRATNPETAAEAFDEYCMWHGLIQWGPLLRRVMNECNKAEKRAKRAHQIHADSGAADKTP